VLKEAMADLTRLSEDAWERQVAMPALLAMRVEIPQDSSDESEREYLMSTQDLYEDWERRTRERGFEQGRDKGRDEGREQEAKRALAIVYEARFGAMPGALVDAIDAVHDTATLERWLALAGTRSQEEIAAAVQAHSTVLVS
jgi:predicted transposase YdaD